MGRIQLHSTTIASVRERMGVGGQFNTALIPMNARLKATLKEKESQLPPLENAVAQAVLHDKGDLYFIDRIGTSSTFILALYPPGITGQSSSELQYIQLKYDKFDQMVLSQVDFYKLTPEIQQSINAISAARGLDPLTIPVSASVNPDLPQMVESKPKSPRPADANQELKEPRPKSPVQTKAYQDPITWDQVMYQSGKEKGITFSAVEAKMSLLKATSSRTIMDQLSNNVPEKGTQMLLEQLNQIKQTQRDVETIRAQPSLNEDQKQWLQTVRKMTSTMEDSLTPRYMAARGYEVAANRAQDLAREVEALADRAEEVAWNAEVKIVALKSQMLASDQAENEAQLAQTYATTIRSEAKLIRQQADTLAARVQLVDDGKQVTVEDVKNKISVSLTNIKLGTKKPTTPRSSVVASSSTESLSTRSPSPDLPMSPLRPASPTPSSNQTTPPSTPVKSTPITPLTPVAHSLLPAQKEVHNAMQKVLERLTNNSGDKYIKLQAAAASYLENPSLNNLKTFLLEAGKPRHLWHGFDAKPGETKSIGVFADNLHIGSAALVSKALETPLGVSWQEKLKESMAPQPASDKKDATTVTHSPRPQ